MRSDLALLLQTAHHFCTRTIWKLTLSAALILLYSEKGTKRFSLFKTSLNSILSQQLQVKRLLSTDMEEGKIRAASPSALGWRQHWWNWVPTNTLNCWTRKARSYFRTTTQKLCVSHFSFKYLRLWQQPGFLSGSWALILQQMGLDLHTTCCQEYESLENSLAAHWRVETCCVFDLYVLILFWFWLLNRNRKTE